MSRRSRSPGPVAGGLPGNTTAYGTPWIRINPVGATRNNGVQESTNPLDTNHVTFADDGASTTITWKSGQTWSSSEYKHPGRYASCVINTGHTWGQVSAVRVWVDTSSAPADAALMPVWGILVNNKVNPDAGSPDGSGGQVIQGVKNDSGKIFYNSRTQYGSITASPAYAAAYSDLIGVFQIFQGSPTNMWVSRIGTTAVDTASPAISAGSPTNNNASGNKASASDPMFVGICAGTFGDTDPGSDISCVAKFYYSLLLCGDHP